MHRFLRLALAVIAAVAVISAGGCSGAKSIVVGISPDAAPLSSRGADGNPEGFAVEMAREACKRMGMEIHFKFVNISEKSKIFDTNGVDALWGQLVPDAQNKKTMLFTKPYMADSQVLVVESDSKFQDGNDLGGKTIGTVKGTAAEKALRDSGLAAKAAGGAPLEFSQPLLAFLALDGDRADAVAVDENYAYYLLTKHAERYRILDGKLSSEEYAVAVRRNDIRLKDAFEKALLSMKADGTSTNISQKWFGMDMT